MCIDWHLVCIDWSDFMSERPRRLSLLRSLAPADFITLGNSATGTAAVLLCIRHARTGEMASIWTAMGLLVLAFVLDAMDGYVARRTKRSSPYGGDLDSLADIVSFGVAPAAIGYVLGLSGGWDLLILCYFVACGIGRLARFNVTAIDLTTDNGKVSHFEGTPIPTSLVVVAILALLLLSGRMQQGVWGGAISLGWTLHPLTLLYAISGSLMMTATLKIPKL